MIMYEWKSARRRRIHGPKPDLRMRELFHAVQFDVSAAKRQETDTERMDYLKAALRNLKTLHDFIEEKLHERPTKIGEGSGGDSFIDGIHSISEGCDT